MGNIGLILGYMCKFHWKKMKSDHFMAFQKLSVAKSSVRFYWKLGQIEDKRETGCTNLIKLNDTSIFNNY